MTQRPPEDEGAAGVGPLPDDVRRLIYTSVPSIDTLEILVSIARAPERRWTPRSVAEQFRPARMTLADIEAYFALLASQEVIAFHPDGSVEFQAGTGSIAQAVEGLVRAYNERPVTLIRTVYSIADGKNIQAFADAFRLRRGD